MIGRHPENFCRRSDLQAEADGFDSFAAAEVQNANRRRDPGVAMIDGPSFTIFLGCVGRKQVKSQKVDAT